MVVSLAQISTKVGHLRTCSRRQGISVSQDRGVGSPREEGSTSEDDGLSHGKRKRHLLNTR